MPATHCAFQASTRHALSPLGCGTQFLKLGMALWGRVGQGQARRIEHARLGAHGLQQALRLEHGQLVVRALAQ